MDTAIFRTVTDSALRPRNGQPIDVLRELTAEEIGSDEVGRMFVVRFPDSTEVNAFEDEVQRAVTA